MNNHIGLAITLIALLICAVIGAYANYRFIERATDEALANDRKEN